MKSKVSKPLVAALVLAVLVVIATTYLFVNSMYAPSTQSSEQTDENVVQPQTKKKNNDMIKPREADIMDYEKIYLEYIKENYEYFSRGMILCDLNLDRIPELFSIAYDTDGNLVYYHELRDGAVIAPSEKTVKTYIDDAALLKSPTFFEDTRNFFGMYKDKTTGLNVIINSVKDYMNEDRLDIISFQNGVLSLDDCSEYISDNGVIFPDSTDSIMSDYELADERMYSYYLLRGEYGGEYGNDPVEALKELIAEFRKGDQPDVYKYAPDGDIQCYIRNINLKDGEMEIVPASYITYEQYYNAVNSDKIIKIGDEEMSIQIDENLYREYGIAHLFQMPYFEYQFTVPTEDHPVSVIEKYMGKEPVRVKISDDTKVRYGVLGRYNADGTPDGYETAGRREEYSLYEYYSHFAEYNMGSYYMAVVENEELKFLDVMYHP